MDRSALHRFQCCLLAVRQPLHRGSVCDALAVGRQTVEGMSRMILWNGGALLAQTLVDAPSMALFKN